MVKQEVATIYLGPYSKCPKVRNLESKKGVSAVGKLLLEK